MLVSHEISEHVEIDAHIYRLHRGQALDLPIQILVIVIPDINKQLASPGCDKIGLAERLLTGEDDIVNVIRGVLLILKVTDKRKHVHR